MVRRVAKAKPLGRSTKRLGHVVYVNLGSWYFHIETGLLDGMSAGRLTPTNQLDPNRLSTLFATTASLFLREWTEREWHVELAVLGAWFWCAFWWPDVFFDSFFAYS